MANDRGNPNEELGSIPFGDLIYSVASAIAEGQFKLDQAAMQVAEFMGGHPLLRDRETGQLLTPDGEVTTEAHSGNTLVYFGYTYDEQGKRQPNMVSMMELGFVPTFYQFVDTVIDLKIAVRLRKSGSSDLIFSASITGAGARGAASPKKTARPSSRAAVTATPIDARYASTYNYSADLTSTLSTKLVPVPPPPMLQERIRMLAEQEAADRQRRLDEGKPDAGTGSSQPPGDTPSSTQPNN